MTKILLADDSVTVQRVVGLVLPADGFTVKAVSNGRDALLAAPSFRPDIVFADIDMPGLSGYRLSEELKKNPATKNIPVVLLAGAFETLDEAQVKKSGARDILTKPFAAEDLLSKINSLIADNISASGRPGPAVYSSPAMPSPARAAKTVKLPAKTEKAEDDLWEMEAEAIEEESPAAAVRPAVRPQAAAPFAPKNSDGEILKAAAEKKIAEYLASVDLRAMLREALMPGVKALLESVVWEVAPEAAEKFIKESLKDSAPLAKRIEEIIWKTVPGVAETIIKKEIEKIRAQG